MSNLSNLEPFNILVKLTARAFYGEIGDNEPYIIRDRSNNNKAVSKAEFFLNVLTRYQWVCERALVKDLIVSPKVLRQIMWFLHKEKLVKYEQKGEILKPVRRLHAAGIDAQHDGREGDEKTLPLFNHTIFHTYWCLDYGQIYSVARYKINCLKIKLNNELYSKRRMQKHLCPNCKERYTTLNAEWPFYDDGETVVSDKSHGQLVESDKLVTQGVGGNVDDNVNCCEKLNEVLQIIEEQLMPLVKQLDRVQEMAVPDFGTLAAREVETKTIITNESEIDAINRRVEELKLVKQVNSSNKKFKMDVTSDPSGDKKSSQVPLMPSVKQMHDRAQIDAVNRRVEELKLVRQHLNLFNKKSKMDVTSDPSFDKIKSQVPLMLAKQMQDQAQIDAVNRRVEELKLVRQHLNLFNKKSKMDVTSDPSFDKIKSQVPLMLAKQMQDQAQIDAENLEHFKQYVYNLGQPTSSIPQLGMKRKHGVENIKEVTTPGITEEYCKVDLHNETREDYDDDWELVEHNLILQFCGTL